jgi:uncharacterized protein YjiS (DUF1127 family)
MPSSTLHERRLALSSGHRSRWIIGALREIGAWVALSRERHALAELDDHLLADIGITPDAAAREAAKPFWQR